MSMEEMSRGLEGSSPALSGSEDDKAAAAAEGGGGVPTIGMESGSGVVAFSKDNIVKEDEPVDYSEAKEVQTQDEAFEIVDKEELSKIAQVLSAAESTLGLSSSTGHTRAPKLSNGDDLSEPSVSGRSILNHSRRLTKDVIKLVERSSESIALLKDQIAELKQEKKESTDKLQLEFDAASARATEATERANDVEYALESAESSLSELKRVNRVLILENAIAVEQLKRHQVLGVEIPLLPVSDPFSDGVAHSSGDLGIKVTPLDPTSREARAEASPISKKKVSSRDWGLGGFGSDPNFLATPELSMSSRMSTPQSQSQLLEKNRRRMLQADQPSTPIAIDTSNTSEAVDALMDDLMTRLNMVDLDINYKKLADYQYKIGDKKFHLKNINGRLFTLKGGGYQDLLVVLTSFLRFQ